MLTADQLASIEGTVRQRISDSVRADHALAETYEALSAETKRLADLNSELEAAVARFEGLKEQSEQRLLSLRLYRQADRELAQGLAERSWRDADLDPACRRGAERDRESARRSRWVASDCPGISRSGPRRSPASAQHYLTQQTVSEPDKNLSAINGPNLCDRCRVARRRRPVANPA
jgi:hypothetical protein